MYFKQFYLGCLAQASYLIGSGGEAAVVDPRRDVEIYIEEAESQGLKIKYVLETHLHADFVSGHLELARRTGAQIAISDQAAAKYEHLALREGSELQVGQVTLRVMETPGHTPESICIQVIDRDESAETQAVFTGDTLFIGDVGRPDLAGGRGFTPQQMAAALYESLHFKLLRLPDDVKVYPAHGAGSLCGRQMSEDRVSTIGRERATNYALKAMEPDAFVAMMTQDLPEAPAYFTEDVRINRDGPQLLEELLKKATPRTPDEVEAAQQQGVWVLDTRAMADFDEGHVPGAVNVALSGTFGPWVGAMIPPGTPLVVVTGEGDAPEAVTRLGRVGYEDIRGYLQGGMPAWQSAGKPTATIAQLEPRQLRERLASRDAFTLLDVRTPSEFEGGHIEGALSIPLRGFLKRLPELDPARPTVVICGSGYRSNIAASFLRRGGFKQLWNVTGGMSAWEEEQAAVAAG